MRISEALIYAEYWLYLVLTIGMR